MKTEQLYVKIEDLTLNPENPRSIKKDQYEKLKESIQKFPEMLKLSEVVIDELNIVLRGNMRTRVMFELGYSEVYVKRVIGLSNDQKMEFMVKDNLHNGEFDMDLIANMDDETQEQFKEWGIDLPDFNYSDQNKEIDYNDLEGKMELKFKVSESQYFAIVEKLEETGEETRDSQLLKILNIESN